MDFISLHNSHDFVQLLHTIQHNPILKARRYFLYKDLAKFWLYKDVFDLFLRLYVSRKFI